MTEKERVTVDLDAQCYYLDDEFWISWDKFGEDMAEAINKLLNEQEETIQTQKDYIIRMGHGTIFEEMKRLKERNQRQYERLKEITDLMCARDWKTLETMVDDWEQAEEQLEREWGTYSDLDG